MFKYKNPPKKIVFNLILLSIMVSSALLLVSCGGSQFPFDNQGNEGSYLDQEYAEGRAMVEAEANARKNDPCLDDVLSGVPEELQRCEDKAKPTNTPSSKSNTASNTTIKGCVNVSSLNLRSGPGVNYDALGYLLKDQCIVLQGRNSDGSWVAFKDGWVSTYYLDISGSVKSLPLATNKPNSAASSSSSSSNTSSSSSGGSSAAVCSCSGNNYNCKNFSTHQQAQNCYEYCYSVVGYDIHWLDDDKDGRACESLP